MREYTSAAASKLPDADGQFFIQDCKFPLSLLLARHDMSQQGGKELSSKKVMLMGIHSFRVSYFRNYPLSLRAFNLDFHKSRGK